MNKKGKLLVLFLVAVFAILQLVSIYLSNSISTNSIYASDLQKKVEVLQEKNSHLKTEVLEYSSYDSVSSRAATLGFSQNKKNTISLSGPDSFAKR